MLLRSSSTPVLGSLLSDSPNNNNIHHRETSTAAKHHHHHHLPHPHQHHHHHHHHHLPPIASSHHTHNKRSFGHLNFPPVSCNSSPISPSIADLSGSNKGFRRAQSDGNLEGLASDDFSNKNQQSNKFPGRNKCSMLQTIQSFSFSNPRGRREDEEKTEDLEGNERGRERVMAVQGGEFAFQNEKASRVFSEEVKVMDKIWNVGGADGERGLVGQEMYLARGLGIVGGGGGGGGGGSGGEFNPAGSGGDNGDNHGVEEYYKKMVKENPGNPLFMRNYAQFLYQSKQDLHGAEEYYSRAILADPGDGEILSQYAKLVWELHHDQDRAFTYFERATQASPEDCHVQAAYAGFLWETEENGEECHAPNHLNTLPQQFQGAVASATA